MVLRPLAGERAFVGEWRCLGALVFPGYSSILRHKVRGVLLWFCSYSILLVDFVLYFETKLSFLVGGGWGLLCLRLASNSLCCQYLKPLILLSSSLILQCWAYRQAQPHLAYGVLRIKPGGALFWLS